MSDNSAIEWTDTTWNPTTGCDRVSDGCDNCYAMTLAKRLKAMGSAKYQSDGDPRTSGPGFGLTVHPDALDAPLHWRAPRKVFVNSMSDLFHDKVPDEFIADVFAVMALSTRHIFQVLTKRHGRMRSLLCSLEFAEMVNESMVEWAVVELRDSSLLDHVPNAFDGPLPNVWLGVSVENQWAANIRIPKLLETPAAVRFLSCEPLIGPIELRHGRYSMPPDGAVMGTSLDGIGWVIAGGESGARARPVNPDWIRSIRDQCVGARVPFLFKQWGGRTPKTGGRELDGRTWDEYPAVSP